MMIITQITEHDLERLFEIEQSAHLVPWSMGILKNTQGENYLNLKLTYYDQTIAFAICQHILDEATLLNIAVAPSFQGKGFGKQLLNHLLQQLTEKGISTLWLEVRESNIAAQKLYEQLGFNEVDRRKNYYPTPHGQRENAIVMARYL
ncbi:ribosomal protein S18-alanine N-acetyltransferase [Pasteurella multocida]|uniref:ribosomal protein S18-alanine N-acetyltransferase n=1 Tax=Pasteurella multocida TaxID=747 RepID=UPI00202567BB|nr:ribosomal protein S18-alanine N-acetyltransferase [Pasteurella multocida]URJ84611.1 ribosomal protein S18-alanine N-acetyltransferase [Pasteurella multocida]WRK03282.1 ribosomal protein S18-alanine N-acetyltransferase [Pasteurella multocida]HDR1799799.1 ribosomal protein S18-alanine N-acetyltransferase [Pasteurella multocida]